MEGIVKVELPKKLTGVLYLDRDSFTYFDSLIGGSVSYQYQPEVISDLEVLNEEILYQHIASLVQDNKLTPTQLVILLSPSLMFEKKIPPSQPGEASEADVIQKFVETVPFESVSFTKIVLADGIQVIAGNTNFFMAMKQGFEKQGFIVPHVFPVEVFAENVANGVTMESVVKILAKVDAMKQYDLLQDQKKVILPTEKKMEIIPHEKKSQNRVYLLGGLFIILVGILIVMLILRK
jgi:hypothetical protein